MSLQNVLPPYHILSYTSDHLSLALSNEWISADETARAPFTKYLLDYFDSALQPIRAKTLLIEKDFLSPSYLEEYAGFYAAGFASYSRYCKRIHFFSTAFSFEQFDMALYDENALTNAIWESYLGYVVVKPLPHARAGETLAPAPQGTGVCHPACRDYTIQLYGKTLTLCSLLFQPSDGVVVSNEAAALWVALEKAAQTFKTSSLSLVEMARLGSRSIYESRRSFPWTGPDMAALEKALTLSGLAVEYREAIKPEASANWIKGFIYAYLKMGAPVLMELKRKDAERRLIAITGYKEIKKTVPAASGLVLESENIACFYAHDDETGPFSVIQMEPSYVGTLHQPAGKTKGSTPRREQAVSLMVALHPSINSAFEDIHYWGSIMDSFLKKNFNDLGLVWAIYLTSGADYKSEVRSGKVHTKRLQYKIYTRPAPEYIWVARGRVDGMGVIELIFDAGASPESCVSINVLDINFQLSLRELLEDESLREEAAIYLGNPVIAKMLEAEAALAYLSISDICLRFIRLWMETKDAVGGVASIEYSVQASRLLERLKEIFQRRGAAASFDLFEKNPADKSLQMELNQALEADMNDQTDLATTLLNMIAAPPDVSLTPKTGALSVKAGKKSSKPAASDRGVSPIQLFELDNIEKTIEKIKLDITELREMWVVAGVASAGDYDNQIQLLKKKWAALEEQKRKIRGFPKE